VEFQVGVLLRKVSVYGWRGKEGGLGEERSCEGDGAAISMEEVGGLIAGGLCWDWVLGAVR
jgi:hypothetical protein